MIIIMVKYRKRVNYNLKMWKNRAKWKTHFFRHFQKSSELWSCRRGSSQTKLERLAHKTYSRMRFTSYHSRRRPRASSIKELLNPDDPWRPRLIAYRFSLSFPSSRALPSSFESGKASGTLAVRTGHTYNALV